MDLSSARVLVTGGSSGIGRAIAGALCEAGAAVVIAGRTEEPLRAAAEAIGATPVQADVSVEADAVRLVEETTDALGGLDALVNNAGVGYIAPLLETEADAFEDVWRTNVLGAMLVAREAAGVLVEQGQGGSIVNVGSTAALGGFAGGGPYTATKFALRALTESWRAELRTHGIRVMQVNPSEVMTPFGDNLIGSGEGGSSEDGSGGSERTFTEAERETKLRAEEIAHTVLAMLSMDDRGFVTEATVFATNPQ